MAAVDLSEADWHFVYVFLGWLLDYVHAATQRDRVNRIRETIRRAVPGVEVL